MSDQNTQALAHYNRLFDNQQYQAIADNLANDLNVERDAFRVSDIMNMITDVALEISGHTYYTKAWIKLASLCGQHPVSPQTIDLITDYLQIYQSPRDTRADDFRQTAHALQQSYAALSPLQTALSHANGIHGWRGRTAYHLLSASDYVMQAAVQLLINGDRFYIREKLHHGLSQITYALQEGIRHSSHPDKFDFSAIKFPEDQDNTLDQ